MKPALKVIFQPTSNRNFTNRRVSAVIYAARFTPLYLICIFAALTVNNKFWFLLFFIIFMAVGFYYLEDRITDKLSWTYFWKRHYSTNNSASQEHALMKELENNPSPNNKKKIARHFKNE